MYPPRFDLRHFMSHLAPGGYYFLQLFLLAIFIFWLFFPATPATLANLAKLNKANQVLLIFGFLITGVLCYFIGVVLRLPPVNEVDDVSAENNLREELKLAKVDSDAKEGVGRSDDQGLTSKANLRTRVSQLAYILGGLVWKTPPFTCKQVYDLLNGSTKTTQELQGEKVVQLIQALKRDYKTDSNEHFRDWLKGIAAKYLEEARKQAIFSGRTVGKFLKEPERKWVISWLWAADSFPYSLWLSYRIYLRAGPERHQEFEQRLWPVLLETMGGEVSKITRTHVPFNRCKLFVMTRSPDLASDVYDREALTRMMAGFYRGLRLGSRVALLTLILSMVLWVCKQLGIFEWWFNPSLQGVGYVILVSIFSLLFNWSLLIKVVNNFRILRMNESDAVFESYLIALSLNSKQA